VIPVRALRADVSSAIEKTGTWRTFRPMIDRARCTRCNVCWKFCPDVAITLDAEGWPVIDYDHCKGCGICEVECAPRAIAMEKE
jgi:pyruvate ferredoxin oxidoreductase delta subunit